LPDLLASLPLFRACRPDAVAALAARLRWQTLRAGDTVMSEGEDAAEFAILLSGRAVVTRRADGTDETLATALPGAVLGELALLRAAPRTASVIAATTCEMGFGGLDALALMLQLPGVHDQIRNIASTRLARDARPVRAPLRDGTQVALRPLLPSDRSGLEAAVDELSAESLRRRFFSPKAPSAELLDYLVDIDFIDHFAWLVIADGTDPGSGVATARYIRQPPSGTEAEVAFSVVDAHQGRGIGQLMLGAIGVAAVAAGIEDLLASVLVENAPMLAVLRKSGAHIVFDEAGVLSARVAAEACAARLDPELRGALDRVARDIVTGAGLALT
jgi:CRP-like cAMP-binding protein